MHIERQKFKCKRCGEFWTGEMIQNVPISVWVAHVRSIRCPNCGAATRYICFVADQRDLPPAWNIEGTPLGDKFKEHLKREEDDLKKSPPQ